MTVAAVEVAPGLADEMPLLGFDHLELWVGNAVQASHYFVTAFGFREVARAGLETGSRDRASRVVRHGDVCVVLTAPLTGDGEVAEHVRRHGDGVRSIGLTVPDAAAAYRVAVERGARGVEPPRTLEDDDGTIVRASIATYGETLHTFVERAGYRGTFMPGFAVAGGDATDAGLLTELDHVVGNVELGKMNEWVDFYARVLGFTQLIQFTGDDISTEYSALMSKVMSDGTGRIKFPINEPAEGRRRSQVDEYLQFYDGPGVQHVALQTGDIVTAVRELAGRGVTFLATPNAYYDALAERFADLDLDVTELRELGILADRDDEGYLLQIFTRPIGDRPTLFFELIERHGSRGFGSGNFKALFQALEREQALRGNL